MTAQAKDPTLAMRCPSPLVLFGIDNRGKPKGARFGKEHASLAMKAATQLQLKVLASNDPKIAEIAARLPVGRVHATGRTFVPFIRRDLYDKLVAAAANGNAHPASPPNGSLRCVWFNPWRLGAPFAAKLARDRPRRSGRRKPESLRTAGTRPSSSRQTATCSPCAGVTTRGNAGSCAIGFGLDCSIPGPDRQQKMGNQRKTSAHAKHDKPVATNPGTNGQSLPKDWDEIDINHLVLAKDDSQWGAWWEAIPVEKAGDLFKLRWREKYAANVPLITRPRLDLALHLPRRSVTANLDGSGLEQVRASFRRRPQ